MASFLDGIKDLLKYKIISHVNTGDKNLDNIVNALSLTVLSIVIAPTLKHHIYFIINKLFGCCMKYEITRSNFDSIVEYVELYRKDFTSTTWWLRSDTEKLTAALIQHIANDYNWIFSSNSLFLIDNDGNRKLRKQKNVTDDWFLISQHLIHEKVYPIYRSKTGIVAITKNKNEDICFIHSNEATIIEFIKYINKKYKEELSEVERQGRAEFRVTNYFTGKSKYIYKDRTFDKIITKHKSKIINTLNHFRTANYLDGISKYNGLGTYNVGILLYGPPGTGKTSIIKAVSNYLKRNAVIVDMKKIKTIKQLEELSMCYHPDNNIYIFDEFDFIQESLQRKSKSVKEDIMELYAHINKLLTSKLSSVIKENSESVDKEIENLRLKIEELENAINLENMLTWMDGTVEMRNRIIIAATNNIEKIDQALIREGRFDIKLCLEEFDNNEIRDLLTLMYGPEHKENIEKHTYKEKTFTPAKIINMASQTDDMKQLIDQLAIDRPKQLIDQLAIDPPKQLIDQLAIDPPKQLIDQLAIDPLPL